MKKLNNAILNNIVEKFVKRKKYKRKKLSILGRLINITPLPSFFIFLGVFPYMVFKNKQAKEYDLLTIFSALILSYFVVGTCVMFVTLLLSHFINSLSENNNNFLLCFGIISVIVDQLIMRLTLKGVKENILNIGIDIEEEKVFSEMLTKEDFILIANNFNSKIVQKAVSDRMKDGLSYADLSKLDELLEDEKSSLDEIHERSFFGVFHNIDKDMLIEDLKGKSQEEMIEYFENLGIEINNKSDLIKKEREDHFLITTPIGSAPIKKELKEEILM